MKQMGVQYVRDEWGWEGVEKTKGVYAMSPEGQHKFDALNAAGIKIICALDYGNKLYANPLDPDAFANYAAWMARTYKGKVVAWEIWNEPDNFYFFKQYGGARSKPSIPTRSSSTTTRGRHG
jgi:beta-glucosidase/6-phospho-beta-glucosidase/beta-galactosidase